MSQPRMQTVRYTLAGAVVLAALAALACVSGNGGSIGDGCQSKMDCMNQYECLAIDDAGACSTTVMTCQQTCSSECLSLGTNYVCTPIKCAGVDNAAVCIAH